jgi:D-aminopeptidase
MSQQPRRARNLGIVPGVLPTGRYNAITDVEGVGVGHATIVRGEHIRTGVTAVVPNQLVERRTLPAGLTVGNGYGKLVGSTQIAELGVIETPIVLTATLSTFRVADALVTYVLSLPGREEMQSVNPVVGETNDGFLSDIRSRPIDPEHVFTALRDAAPGLPGEGAVGAGTGTSALGFKAGIGTSSRVIVYPDNLVTVGALVQSNFSGILTVAGVPIRAEEVLSPESPLHNGDSRELSGDSCMIVLATDARLDGRQLGRLARRAIYAMARVGSNFASDSGDYALAFSTADQAKPGVAEKDLDRLFAAVSESVEEALLNSLFMAKTVMGFRGHIKYAVPHDRVLEMLRAHTPFKIAENDT